MTKLRFLGDLSLLGGIALAVLVGCLCYWLYRRETLQAGLAYGRLLPLLRSIAVGLIVLMLTGPTLQHRWREGEPGRLTIVVDDSDSMNLTDGESSNRFKRAVDGLLGYDPDLLLKLAEVFEIKVVRGSNRQTTELWSSTLEQITDLPESASAWQPSSYGKATELGDLLDREQSSVVVLLSDGQINSGTSLVEAAQRIPFGQRPIFTVGFGQATEPPDLAIVDVEHPDRLFRRDVLTGKVIVRDTMPTGQSFRLQAWSNDILAWEQRLTTVGSEQRSISYSFPIEKLVVASETSDQTERSTSHSEFSAIPIDLQFRIVDCPSEANTLNNSRDVHIWGDLHRSKVLLVDGRSRWETRYLKNVFERDNFWDINAVIAEPTDLLGGDSRLPIGNRPGQFPSSRDDLMQYDLVILGELPAKALTQEEQKWLVDFVEQFGGGLIAIDGQRSAWLAPELAMLARLLPVQRLENESSDVEDLTTVQLTPAGRSLAALEFNDGEKTWNRLSPFRWLARTEVVPGGEILATSKAASVDTNLERPVFATRLHGAGRVFYSASDETWRWRYKLADEVHQRFWNQIARWVMRAPYVVESDFVSLDAGRMTYKPNDAIEIRCRLKQDDLSPLEHANVEAIIERDGQRALSLSLEADSALPGVYRGTAANLPAGNYTVTISASGVPRQALAVSTKFVIVEPESVELNKQNSDIETLRRVAELTGGRYIPEKELPSLIEHLKPLSHGRIVQSETILWQSYYWFLPVLACLSVEWWLRKRAGLI
ncbi:MAG: hypothetical protein SGI77_07020 [Pirellulaceae bacterium]|nr:hypothetical protein [Pirellulaceae bacterium]